MGKHQNALADPSFHASEPSAHPKSGRYAPPPQRAAKVATQDRSKGEPAPVKSPSDPAKAQTMHELADKLHPMRAERGADRVPGKLQAGKPKDTVPAVLSPGEAVLNRGAAKALGRPKIAALNRANDETRR